MSQVALDSVWVLFSAFLVFFMHAGFALVEAGFCRRKNAVMVLTKNVTVIAVASILFYLVGFGVMFGGGSSWIGTSLFAPGGAETPSFLPEGMPLFVFLFFQMVFAATAATIVSGAVAERVKLSSFIAFVVIATAVIYPIVGHWVWGGGVLAEQGFHDFAGSTVVHAVGGGMALAGVLLIGPRLGRFRKDDDTSEARPLAAHSIPLAALGVLILWLGWFGFNGGSTLSADAGAIAPIILSTNLAAAAGFVVALAYAWMRNRFIDLGMALNGALAGLVSITAGCDVIGPFGALAVGGIGAVIVVEGIYLMERLELDDPVGAVPVHLMAGLFGTLAVGLFANTPEVVGLLNGGGTTLLLTQILGALLGGGFAFVAGGAVWFVLKVTIGIRVSVDHELEGLDAAECGVDAYGLEPEELEAILTRAH